MFISYVQHIVSILFVKPSLLCVLLFCLSCCYQALAQGSSSSSSSTTAASNNCNRNSRQQAATTEQQQAAQTVAVVTLERASPQYSRVEGREKKKRWEWVVIRFMCYGFAISGGYVCRYLFISQFCVSKCLLGFRLWLGLGNIYNTTIYTYYKQ